MRRIIYLLLVSLLLVPIVSATDISLVNKPMLLWGSFGLSPDVVNIVSANVTIVDPNLAVVVNNESMIKNGSNIFYYGFSPNVAGIYLMSVSYLDSGGTFYISESTFYVEESETMSLSLIIGLISILVMLLYYGNRMMEKNSYVGQLFGFSLFSGSALVVSIIAFMMMKFSETASYYPVMRTVFIIVFVVMMLLIFVFFYILMALGGKKVADGAVELVNIPKK